MIPPLIGPDAVPGERLVYQRLAEDPDCKEWVVLHSLHLAEVRRAVEGEIDFVVIVPKLGVLCLEVKSHRTVDRGIDGLWRLGKDAPTTKSPFVQAARGMHGLLDYLGRKRTDIQQVPFWSGVWFTGASANLPDTPEWHSWQLLDRQDLRRPISVTLSALLSKARAHLAKSRPWFDPDAQEPAAELCDVLAAQLRPRFELAMTSKEVAKERSAERLAFVQEQYEALDLMEQEPRVLFTGPAGTGKTLLAVEAARRAALRGDKVLLVCYNRLLGASLANALSDLPDSCAQTLHSYMLTRAASLVPESAAAQWWQDELPELALGAVLDEGVAFDTLVVDEVQDIAANAAYMDVLDASLRGGLGGGRWLMFGDFERQMIYGAADGRSELSARCGHFSRPALGHNCRNTPQIGAVATRLAAVPSNAYKGYRRRDDGVAPIFRAYFYQVDQQQLLMAAIEALKAEHYRDEEIVVLSPKAESAAAIAAKDGNPHRLTPAGERGKKIGYSTIQSFKGMDSPAVIITDIEEVDGPSAEALLYVSLSRASDRLYVFARSDSMARLAKLLVEGRS
jgi:hypothetical protein